MATREAPKAELDLDKLSVEEMIALSNKLQERAKEVAGKLFDETITFLADKLKAMGKLKSDAAVALYTLMDPQEQASFLSSIGASSRPMRAEGVTRTRAPRGSGKPKEAPQSQDKNGNLPEKGTTYKNPETGETWTKTGPRAKDSFVALVKAGKTWAELKA